MGMYTGGKWKMKMVMLNWNKRYEYFWPEMTSFRLVFRETLYLERPSLKTS
jgi:hypothetical protein